MKSSRTRAALILGLLTAIGPFAIDMYLPTLPMIGQSLAADTATVQFSLMAFLLPFGICQLIYGPVSDLLGRKRPLYFGLCLFVLGSILCAVAPTIELLIAARFIQGVGACASMVLPRAVVRDRFTGTDATRLMTTMMLVFSVAPIFAPLTGSALLLVGDWRLVFWTVSGIGLLGLALAIFALEETRGPEARAGASLGRAFAAYGTLLRDGRFLALSLIGGFGVSGFFLYLANATFVLQEGYGLTPMQFALMFSLNAVAFIGVAQSAGWLASRFGMETVLRRAVQGFVLFSVILAGLFLAGFDSLPVLAGMLFLAYGCLGLVMPLGSVLAMDLHGPIAGAASALMGTFHLVTGSIMMGVVAAIGDGGAVSMVTGIASCGLLAFALLFVLGAPRAPQPVVEH